VGSDSKGAFFRAISVVVGAGQDGGSDFAATEAAGEGEMGFGPGSFRAPRRKKTVINTHAILAAAAGNTSDARILRVGAIDAIARRL